MSFGRAIYTVPPKGTPWYPCTLCDIAIPETSRVCRGSYYYHLAESYLGEETECGPLRFEPLKDIL